MGEEPVRVTLEPMTAELLPDGKDTGNSWLLTIVDDAGTHVGTL